MDCPHHIFISYVREDEGAVSRLARELEALEFSVWLDRAQLDPGVRWKDEIRRAIGRGAAFVACFSQASEARDRSYMREELALACEELRLRPRHHTWFIPTLLGACEVPDIPIGFSETLRDLQYVDLHDCWEVGVRRLVAALRPVDAVVDRLLERAASPAGGSSERLPMLDRAVEFSPRRRDVRRARARARIAAGLTEAAVEDYEEAAPDYAAERAWCYWLASDPDSALALYKRLAKLDAATARDHFDLGCLLYNVPRFDEALEAFLAAAGAAPDARAPRLAALRVMLRQADHERTTRFADATEARFGEHADACEARAFAMVYRCKVLSPWAMSEEDVRTYDHRFIIEQLSRAHSLDPSNPRRLFRAAMLLFRLNDYRNSEEAATEGLRLMPESSSFRAVLAQVAEYGPADGGKDLATSARLYQEAAQMEPDELDRDDEMPVFDGDDRAPRPQIRRYATIPLTIAGTATVAR